MTGRAALLLLGVLVAACQPDARRAEPAAAPSPGTGAGAEAERRGVVMERTLQDLALTDDRGKPFRLGDLRGRAVLLAFGYTHCPDACPMTLADLRSVKARLGERARETAFVFVSVDGARDAPPVLHRYVKHFDPEFIGLTGTEAALGTLARDFGLVYEVHRPSDGSESYSVDHTVATYLVDRAGRLRVVYPFRTPPEEIAGDVLALLSRGAPGP